MQSLMILGRQPELGIAELESLFGGQCVTRTGRAALLDIEPSQVALKRLGGTIKLCRLLDTLPVTDWHQIEKHLLGIAPERAAQLPEGKLHLGLSAYDLAAPPQQLLATGLRLKKVIQAKTGRSVRLAPNKASELNTAQVIHNRLIGPLGWELVLLRDGDKTLLAQTVDVQDIDSYSERDFARPKRDAKVGMLPPKLAQIIINVAAGSADLPPRPILLDPFCGTGVILQEALLMDMQVIGTDIEPRMIDYTKQNLEWLRDKHSDGFVRYLDVADATSHAWFEADTVDIVASETYLGRPFTHAPEPAILAQTVAECNTILKKFLHNIQPQLHPGTRLCLALPAWQIRPKEFKYLPLIDQIEELGYNQVRFEHVRGSDLLYFRPDQLVARQLLIITRK